MAGLWWLTILAVKRQEMGGICSLFYRGVPGQPWLHRETLPLISKTNRFFIHILLFLQSTLYFPLWQFSMFVFSNMKGGCKVIQRWTCLQLGHMALPVTYSFHTYIFFLPFTLCCVCFVFETGSYYVSWLQTHRSSTCFCFLSDGIKGMCYHAQNSSRAFKKDKNFTWYSLPVTSRSGCWDKVKFESRLSNSEPPLQGGKGEICLHLSTVPKEEREKEGLSWTLNVGRPHKSLIHYALRWNFEIKTRFLYKNAKILYLQINPKYQYRL